MCSGSFSESEERVMDHKALPLVVELRIPYCIREEPYYRHIQMVGSNGEKNAYMAALKRELLSWEGELEGYEVCALRLLGPSATVMSPDLLGDLLKTAREILPMAHGAEVSVDTHPLTVGTPSLTGLAAGRPNRMELMMRSGSDEELQNLGCVHTMQQVKNAVLFFNRFHVNNFGLTVDLGIPGQTAQSFHNTLHACTIIRPAHIRLQTPDVRNAAGMPDEEMRFSLYRDGCAFLTGEGYRQYTAADFCLPQHECRHTLARLEGAGTLGLGLGAVSLLDGFLTRNTNNPAIYFAHAGDFEKTTAEAYSADTEYLMREYVRQRLQAAEGLSNADFQARFGRTVPASLREELEQQEETGELTVADTGYRPTERGLFRCL